MRKLLLALAAMPLLLAAGATSSLAFRTFIVTDLGLGDVVWTGKQFLYVPESRGEIYANDARGCG